MILFLEDWDKYPSAIIDKDTPNTSFVRLASLYREMGIKNNSFMLSLLNPDLQGIDPHRTDLSIEEMLAIGVECSENPWYFFREVIKAPAQVGGNDRPFKANRSNVSLYWLFHNHIFTILEQIRQTGKSFGINGLNVELLNCGTTGTDISLITLNERLRAETLDRIREMEGTLPFYMAQRSKDDISNTEELHISSLNNTFKGFLGSSSEKSANKVGRGLTTPVLEGDEVAFIPNISISLPAALAAGVAARDLARESNSPYGTVLATTSGYIDDRDGGYIYRLMQASYRFNEGLYDCRNIEEVLKIIEKNSSNIEGVTRAPRVYCTWNHRQLGYDDKWLARAIRESEATGDKMLMDFFNVWNSGSVKSPFTREQTKAIRESVVEDYYNDISGNGYCFRWYLDTANGRIQVDERLIKQRMEESTTTLGVDTSDAVGRDDIGMTIRCDETGEILAVANINETNLIHYSEWLAAIIIRFPKLTCIVERKSSGITILDNLIILLLKAGEDPFKRLFNRIVNDADQNPEDFEEINKPLFARSPRIYEKFRKSFGFATAGSGITSRGEIYGQTFNQAIRYTATMLKDKTLIDQLLALVIKNDRIDHQPGLHDDLVVSTLLSYWLISKGRNLTFYGKKPFTIMSRNNQIREVQKEESSIENTEQKYIREELEEIAEEIRSTEDQFIIQKLENKARFLAKRIVLKNNEKFSIDAFIQDLRDERAEHKEEDRFSKVDNKLLNYGYGYNTGYVTYR